MLIRQSVLFFGTAVWRVLIISALLLLPCFWHKRIEAGDAPSHTFHSPLVVLKQRSRELRLQQILDELAILTRTKII